MPIPKHGSTFDDFGIIFALLVVTIISQKSISLQMHYLNKDTSLDMSQ